MLLLYQKKPNNLNPIQVSCKMKYAIRFCDQLKSYTYSIVNPGLIVSIGVIHQDFIAVQFPKVCDDFHIIRERHGGYAFCLGEPLQ